MNLKRFIPAFGLFSAILIVGALFAHPSFAATGSLAGDQLFGGATANSNAGSGFAAAVGLGTTSLPVLIASIIRIILGFLGILTVVFILYGGFMYMTSGGNDLRIKTAKRILTSAIIGLVIVLSAFAVTQFILNSLTSPGGVGNQSDGGGNGGGINAQIDKVPTAFTLVHVNTQCSDALRNVTLQFVFSNSVSSKQGIHVFKGKDEVHGSYTVSGKKITFTPSSTCANPGDLAKKVPCFDANTDYTYVVDPAVVVSATGAKLKCIGLPQGSPACNAGFKTGEGIDTHPPTAEFVDPKNGDSVYVGKAEGNIFQIKTVDDTGVANVDFFADGPLIPILTAGYELYSSKKQLFGTNSPLAPGQKAPDDSSNFFTTDGSGEWNADAKLATNKSYEVWGVANDCAGNTVVTKKVSVMLRAASCYNKNTCGGDVKSPDYCGACVPAACKSNADCASGSCSNGVCSERPVIQSVSPDNGAVGNLITIKGTGFGSIPGTVDFLGAKPGDLKSAVPYVCNKKPGIWTDHEIVVQIPTGAVDGAIRVNVQKIPAVQADPAAKPPVIAKAEIPASFDGTNDLIGPILQNGFDVNKMQRPGLCLLDPVANSVSTPITLNGLSFGDKQGSSSVYFSNYAATSPAVSWSAVSTKVTVPPVNTGSYSVQLFAGDAFCLDKDQKLTVKKCGSDLDCDGSKGETCGTARCSELESIKYCASNKSCGVGEGLCMDVRSGSNSLNFVATNDPTQAAPVIASIDSGWKACSNDPKTNCLKDADCKGLGAVCKDAGPKGQYVTIFGSGFGTAVGKVLFKNQSSKDEAMGDALFPDYCTGSFWHDDSITIKVPATYDGGVNGIAFGLYDVSVEKKTVNASLLSQPKEFLVVDDVPTPGICSINPTSGPVGTEVKIKGQYFGNAIGKGGVVFSSSVNAVSVSGWSSTEVASATVPKAAKKGPMFLLSDTQNKSNAVNFAVGNCNDDANLCSVDQQCCKASGTCKDSNVTCDDQAKTSQYAYRVSTSPIPVAPEVVWNCDGSGKSLISPTPSSKWSQNVCLSAVVSATFTQDMNPATLNANNILVQKCASEKDGACSAWEPVAGIVSPPPPPPSVSKSFSFNVNGGKFEANSLYQVTVKGKGAPGDGVVSAKGAAMEQGVTWQFRTAAADATCTIGNVNVNPTNETAKDPNVKVDYLAALVSKDDKCVVLSCVGHSLTWSSDAPDKASVSIAQPKEPPAGNACSNSVLPKQETIDGFPVHITATDIGENKAGVANLNVHFTPLAVTDYVPNCSTACINALPHVTFNAPIDILSPLLVKMYKCKDELCHINQIIDANFVQTIDFDKTTNTASLNFPANVKMDPNTYYRIVLDGSLETGYGMFLGKSGSNFGTDANNYYPNDFSWKFKTKDQLTSCIVDHLAVSPKNVTLTHVGERQEYHAVASGVPDDCAASGQLLQKGSGGADKWSVWTATDAPDNNKPATSDVAFMLKNGSVALSSALPGSCAFNCLNAGSTVTFGQAICGNTKIEYGESCDDGNIANSDGCSSICLLEGNKTSSCGNGKLDAGEQCDDGNVKNSDGCSSLCLDEGSIASGAICGNGLVAHADTGIKAGGESCDDGNEKNGDGCSSDCKWEGGVSNPTASVCGNGVVESGESCDQGPNLTCNDGIACKIGKGLPADGFGCADGSKCEQRTKDGCSAHCLHTGTQAPLCGNGKLDPGEDGDSGPGTHAGLSSSCLLTGSVVSDTALSFCGDGEIEYGEQCEVSKVAAASAKAGGYAVAQIGLNSSLEVDPVTGYAVSKIVTSVNGVNGSADLKLQCSCTEDNMCGDTNAFGCGVKKCCFARPTVLKPILPLDGSKDLCLNTAVSVTFSEEMDPASFGSVDGNGDGIIAQDEYHPNIQLELTEINGDAVTPRIQNQKAIATTCPGNYIESPYNAAAKSTSNVLARAWNWVRSTVYALFGRSVVAAGGYKCLVPVTFEQIPVTHQVNVRYATALVSNATYKLTVKNDVDGSNGITEGVYSKNHVGIFPGDVTASPIIFKTSNHVCTLDVVDVVDNGKDNLQDFESASAGYYSKTGEEHGFEARAKSYRLETASYETIIPIATYGWKWNWDSSDQTENIIDGKGSLVDDSATFIANGKNGTENVMATATVSVDTVNNPSTLGKPEGIKTGAVSETAFLCSNPWPTLPAKVPFIETDKKTNFSFFYCRDAGDANSLLDDLPELLPPTTAVNPDPNFIKELVFNVAGTKDAIGMRVYKNPTYLTPLAWFKQQKFQGTPTATKLDGYDAVQSGTTLYAEAANVNAGSIYSNIYVISYNPDAGESAKIIFDNVLKNFRLNASACGADGKTGCVTDIRLCREVGMNLMHNAKGLFVGCSADGDCLDTCQKGFCSISGKQCADNSACDAPKPSTFCDADKTKLKRDTKRLTDIVQMQSTFDAYGGEHKHCSVSKNQTCNSDKDCSGSEKCVNGYPTIQSGTFIPSMSTSLWPSWQSTLANTIGAALPVDPINQFWKQCKDQGAGFDSASCWNGQKGEFVCPNQSHVYGYQNQGGEEYTLSAQLEYAKNAWASPIDVSQTDATNVQALYSAGVAPLGLKDGFMPTKPPIPGALVCNGSSLGTSNICGDGVKSSNEVCEKSDVSLIDCTIPADPNVKPPTPSKPGHLNSTCAKDCQGFLSTDEAIQAGAKCVAATCGNAVKDVGEVCDDGALNGTYGHCGNGCVAPTSYCGDGYLSGAELCDCGSPQNASMLEGDKASWAFNHCKPGGANAVVSNGVYSDDPSSSCSYDCKQSGPVCGDKIVNGPEQCDGNAPETYAGKMCHDGQTKCVTSDDCANVVGSKACGAASSDTCGKGTICVAGDEKGKKCSTDADCAPVGKGGVCSSPHCANGLNVGKACDASKGNDDCIVGNVKGTCGGAVQYDLTRTRSCNGSSDNNVCTWNVWGSCQGGNQKCGDGIVQQMKDANGKVISGEECDNGAANSNNGKCNKQCKLNACGDGNVYAGVESCDSGANNGQVCSAVYGGTCNYCNNNCQLKTQSGGYCGDNVKNGNESCDNTDISYVCFKSFEKTVDGVVTQGGTVESTCAKDDSGKTGVDPSAESGYKGCPKDYTCRFVGSCNGGEKFKENGQPCTLITASVPLGVKDKIESNTNLCEGGTCAPPVCAQNCGSSCPNVFANSGVQIQSAAPGSVPKESLNLYGTSYTNQGTILLPACSVGKSLSVQVSSTNPKSVAELKLSKPVVIAPPKPAGKAIDVVFMVDLSSWLKNDSGQVDENGENIPFLVDVKKFSLTLLETLSVASASAPQKVNVGYVGFYYDEPGKKQVLIDMVNNNKVIENAQAVSLYDLESSNVKLQSTIQSMPSFDVGKPSFTRVFEYTRDLLAADQTPDTSKFAVLISGGAPMMDKKGNECTAPNESMVVKKCNPDNLVCNYNDSACIAKAAVCIVTGVKEGVVDTCALEVQTEIKKISSVMYDAYGYKDSNFMQWIALNSVPNGIGDVYLDSSLYDPIAATFVAQLYGGVKNVPDANPSLTPIDFSQNIFDLTLPQTFACTGSSLSVPFAVMGLDPNSNETVTVKNPTFTYCPAK